MGNSFTKAEKIVATALGLLQREQILLPLVTPYTVNDFRFAKNDTITIPIRSIATARTFALRAPSPARNIVTDDLSESSVSVKLDTVVYNAVGITDEEATLDVVNFSEQVVAPQVTAVTEQVEAMLYSAIKTANYNTGNVVSWDTAVEGAYKKALEIRKILNKRNVPAAGRVLLVGPDAEVAIMSDERLDSANPAGFGEGALREATIGRFAGFQVVTSNLLQANEMYAFNKTAYTFGNVAPVIPQGAKTGAIRSHNGVSLRWIMDYDPIIGTDRSVLTTYAGVGATADGPVVSSNKTVVRAVKVNVS